MGIAGHDQGKCVLHPFGQIERGASLRRHVEPDEPALAPVWGPTKNLTDGVGWAFAAVRRHKSQCDTYYFGRLICDLDDESAFLSTAVVEPKQPLDDLRR